jgi:integrase
MSRPKNPIPSYRLHKQSGQAVVTIPTSDGGRKDILLGKYGTPESKSEYERILAQLRVTPHGAIRSSQSADLTVNEILLAFLKHAEQHYRHPDGRPTGETENYRDALRHVKRLYGRSPATEFGPLALKAVREQMVQADWARPVVNKQVNRIRRVFKWAAGEELIPFETYQRLTTVMALSKGRTPAREPEPVKPVADTVVSATLPHLPPMVRAMVELQRLTGMRPNEVCLLRLDAIDRSGPVWMFSPVEHKTAYRGKPRHIAIGPKAQAILQPWLEPVIGESKNKYIFNPASGREARYATMRANRKTKVQPSQANRKKSVTVRAPGGQYTADSYRRAIHRAAEAAGVEQWAPNQLRHTFATEVRKRHGLEAVQVLLGHATADVTQIYAERDMELAVNVAAQMG